MFVVEMYDKEKNLENYLLCTSENAAKTELDIASRSELYRYVLGEITKKTDYVLEYESGAKIIITERHYVR